MRFGDSITIRRGGHPKSVRLEGSYRLVTIRYLQAKGNQIYGELLEDDPLAIPPMRAGERLWWSRSIINRDVEVEK